MVLKVVENIILSSSIFYQLMKKRTALGEKRMILSNMKIEEYDLD